MVIDVSSADCLPRIIKKMLAYIGNSFLEKALAICWLGIFIATLVDIFRGSFKDQSTRILWFLFTLFVPGIGMFLYWMWGRTKKVQR
jgi:hypothetical protein